VDKQRLAEVLHRAERLCAERGARLTRQQRTVLALLCASDTPLSAYELLDRMRADIRNPAPPTVYRALDFLLEQGLAHKLESLHAFVGCTHPEHPHAGQFLICSDCGEVEELEARQLCKACAPLRWRSASRPDAPSSSSWEPAPSVRAGSRRRRDRSGEE